MTPVLTVRNLSVSFEARPVIEDLSFEVSRADTLAIIGPNGSGKTVLLRALLNLVPYTGSVAWAPETRLGYVPQKIAADRQLPIEVRDLLAAKARILKLPPTEIDAVAEAVRCRANCSARASASSRAGSFKRFSSPLRSWVLPISCSSMSRRPAWTN
jgi:zinc transport system ATP-binding protein